MASKKENFYIGVDVGGTAIKFGVFDKNKKLVDTFSIKTVIRNKNAEKELLNDIFEAIESYFDKGLAELAHTKKGLAELAHTKKGLAELAHTKKGLAKLAGVGFAVPGPVVDNKLIKAININWKKKCDIVSETKKRFGKSVKVVVLNDANAAALGEYKETLKEKYKSMCLVTLGTGVGTGIILDGKVVEGKSGMAGEVSHMRVDYTNDAHKCSCGNIGCVETIVGTKGIIRVYNKLVGSLSSPVRERGSLSSPVQNADDVKEIVHKAKAGDKIAIDTLKTVFECLSRMIEVLILAYDPEVVLIGGGISHAGNIITKMVKECLKDKAFIAKELPKIEIAKLKNMAGIYGAVAKF